MKSTTYNIRANKVIQYKFVGFKINIDKFVAFLYIV